MQGEMVSRTHAAKQHFGLHGGRTRPHFAERTMFAIVKEGGKQYRVEEGMTLVLEKIPAAAASNYQFKNILLYCNGDDVRIGTPALLNVEVMGEILGEQKGEKLVIQKFRKRESFEKRRGHRQTYTRVRIKKITAAS
jgi:large subunit ribosomal protein L21